MSRRHAGLNGAYMAAAERPVNSSKGARASEKNRALPLTATPAMAIDRPRAAPVISGTGRRHLFFSGRLTSHAAGIILSAMGVRAPRKDQCATCSTGQSRN